MSSKIRKNFTIAAGNLDQLEKAAKTRKISLSALVNEILSQHFNQEVLTQQAIYKELMFLRKTANEAKKLNEVSFEVLTIFLESFFSRAPEIPEEARKAALAKANNTVRKIIEKAVSNLQRDLSLLPKISSDTAPEDILAAASELEDQ